MKSCFIFFVLLIQAIPCFSQVTLPSFFGDNMVLQQNDSVAIWGSDIPNSTITISASWGATSRIETDSNGLWKTYLKTEKASFTKHQLDIKGSTNVKLENILLGEVWLGSGQSNMEMPMKGLGSSPVNGSNEFILNSKNTHIRLFNTERAGSLQPETNVIGKWEEANGSSVSEFSAIGYLFARKIHELLNVPVGIIDASWGGTRIEAWLPEDSLSIYKEVEVVNVLADDRNQRKQPTQIFNGMVHPFQDFGIKGVLWYQGETNRINPMPYKNYLHTLVNSWRSQWKNQELPFYFVQIAPYAYKKYRDTPVINAALIREAQLKASLEIPHTGLIVTTDVGQCDDIHPPEKEMIADRLAYWALAEQYGYEHIQFVAPVFDYMEIQEETVILHFKSVQGNQQNELSSFNQSLTGFTIAGKDSVFSAAKANIGNNGTITVTSDKVSNPLAVRYGFEDCLSGTFYNIAKLPISPFRTDNW